MAIEGVHTVGSLDPAAGGPSRTVIAMCDALAASGMSVQIVTAAARGGRKALQPQREAINVTTVPATPVWTRARQFYQQVRSHLGQGSKSLVHDHGVWLATNGASFRAATAAGVPYVLTPRGMLEPWALEHRAWKKKVAWYTYQRYIVHGAALLHATAWAEARQLRALGLQTPILVTPNGVKVPAQWKQEPSRGSTRQALFLSRVHPKKGLLNLIKAWAAVRPDNWRLVIAGPDEANHRAEVEAAAAREGVEDMVSFTGSIADEAKWTLYRTSDLFVLPTYSENFGVVVAEALASGVPVITTTGAPWSILNEQDCGWWIEIGVGPLQQALREATASSDARRLAMGRRGRHLVQECYTWPAIAETMVGAYRWLLNPSAPRPSSVVPRGAPIGPHMK